METILKLVHIEGNRYRVKNMGVNALLIDGKLYSTSDGYEPSSQEPIDLPFEIVDK